MCFFVKLGRHVIHGERMNSIDFGGHRSEVKITMVIIYQCGVRGDATLCVVIFILCHDYGDYDIHKLYEKEYT